MTYFVHRASQAIGTANSANIRPVSSPSLGRMRAARVCCFNALQGLDADSRSLARYADPAHRSPWPASPPVPPAISPPAAATCDSGGRIGLVWRQLHAITGVEGGAAEAGGTSGAGGRSGFLGWPCKGSRVPEGRPAGNASSRKTTPAAPPARRSMFHRHRPPTVPSMHLTDGRRHFRY